MQVKSKLDQRGADEIAAALVEQVGGARVILACHTSAARLSSDQENVTILGPEDIAEHVVESGLTTWS